MYSSLQGCHTATGTHMPHGITQCYLPPGRGDVPALTPAEAGTRLSDPDSGLHCKEKLQPRSRQVITRMDFGNADRMLYNCGVLTLNNAMTMVREVCSEIHIKHCCGFKLKLSEILRPTPHKLGHFGEVLPSQSLASVPKKLSLTKIS